MSRNVCLVLMLGCMLGLPSCRQAAPPEHASPQIAGHGIPPAPAPLPDGKPVLLKYTSGRPVDFFESERVFDIYSRNLYATAIGPSAFKQISAGHIAIDSGTTAVELKRTKHVKRIGTDWYDKVEVQLNSGPLKGKRGFVISDCVVPPASK